ncbi:hypothetical protein [Streptomyces iconiensis]|uniref:Secreted protein n=1 Tax=Streptomyces iconiensis TaxID=1384038 RepID=A0ABT6ZZP9_9ACTN|nr:hypothetical protein [Streptomyces iconiensis]MDJ1134555.1 hypothetical protein [Streptomyces iconiensis]
MTHIRRTYRTRCLVAGLLTAGLVGAGATAAAVTGPQDPEPAPAGASVEASTDSRPVVKTHHATADHKVVRPWQEFRIHGRVTGIRPGTPVVLQQKQGGVWRSLPAKTAVNRDSTYSLRVKLGLKGKNELRLVADRTVSNTLVVTVR